MNQIRTYIKTAKVLFTTLCLAAGCNQTIGQESSKLLLPALDHNARLGSVKGTRDFDENLKVFESWNGVLKGINFLL